MLRLQFVRQGANALKSTPCRPAVGRFIPSTINRHLHASAPSRRADKKDPTGGPVVASEHEGSFARTDGSIHVEYPEEEGELPSSVPVQGRGGLHFKRTLPSFSLEGRVGVVTGGARGLGLVMSQALVISGADIAIVDLNSMITILLASILCKVLELTPITNRGRSIKTSRGSSSSIY